MSTSDSINLSGNIPNGTFTVQSDTTGITTIPSGTWAPNPLWDSTIATTPYIITYGDNSINDKVAIKAPKCFECSKAVESICSYEKEGVFTIILKCHGNERRIDIVLKRFKGDKVDAAEWFADNFTWAFDEDEKWRRVRPAPKTETVHADRKIISDWLDNI